MFKQKVVMVASLLAISGCSHLGILSDDAGLSTLASDVSVPANGEVVYRIQRNPRTDFDALRYYERMGTSRSLYDMVFGRAGRAKTYINEGGK